MKRTLSILSLSCLALCAHADSLFIGSFGGAGSGGTTNATELVYPWEDLGSGTNFVVPADASFFELTTTGPTTITAETPRKTPFALRILGDNAVAFPAGWVADNPEWVPTATNLVSVHPYGTAGTNFEYLAVNTSGLNSSDYLPRDGTLPMTGPLGMSGELIEEAAWPSTTKTADYTASVADHTIAVDASSNTVTISLPATPTTGHILYIKAIDVSNAVSLSGNGNTIDGAASVAFSLNQSITVQALASGNWIIL